MLANLRFPGLFMLGPGCLILGFWMSPFEMAHSLVTEEQLKVKAAFVLNLARFVERSDDPESQSNNDIVMCFYQHNFLHQAVDTIRNKKIHNKVIRFKLVKNLKINDRCEVILIPPSSLHTFLQHNQYENLHNRITITDLSSESPGVSSLENKVIFRLKRDMARLRFEVNKKAAEYLGIKIGSELLKLGIMVTEPDNNSLFNGRGRNKQ